ncbi:MAG: DUF1640 domain-containing protein [Alphaproteobacteria bacterium]|nr:DUF1640 domain-containing protein [Alphaproteobacteria bacterium]
MNAIPFDTLKLADRLQAGGFTSEQAHTAASALAEAASGAELATKGDIEALRTEVKGDIATLRTELKGDIAALRTEVKSDIAALRTELKGDTTALRMDVKSDIAALRAELEKLELRMTVKFGRVMIVAVSIILAAIRYLPPHP